MAVENIQSNPLNSKTFLLTTGSTFSRYEICSHLRINNDMTVAHHATVISLCVAYKSLSKRSNRSRKVKKIGQSPIGSRCREFEFRISPD